MYTIEDILMDANKYGMLEAVREHAKKLINESKWERLIDAYYHAYNEIVIVKSVTQTEPIYE